MTVTLLAAILESALERDLIARNPAKGKNRRVRERAPARSYVQTAGQIAALLDAAGELDREATEERQHIPKRTGRRQYECNVREGTLGSAVKRPNASLAGRDLPPLPDKLTPHSLRRTFASVLYALGESPPVVMAEMGHTSPTLALRVYAQAMRRGEDEQAQLVALVEEGFGHSMDTQVVNAPVEGA